ncbi:GGDEF domain-containing protein [Fusobacterium perfoetens]|uniref:tetratricopeptide repeat-containing diguanylate cyclase n=1 Tax=Fusobacterium perfoetens TaxID=852 RepID=UPI0015A1F1BE|nr:tetratricopeptide repeat-containing diguanylate cyclase [Fusobacterium perfoetens]MCF2624612.1 GGDEF domain-containing protein [Fusobacterium perfoetens]
MKKKLIFFLAASTFIFIAVFKFSNFSNEQKIKFSPVYQTIEEYFTTGYISDKYPLSNEEEKLFIKGLKLYEENNFENAKSLFEKILNSNKIDSVTLFYSNFYLNQCYKELKGHGDFILVENSLNLMKDYPVLSNETHLIWQLISSVMTDIKSRNKIISLLDSYLKEAKGMTLESKLNVKGFIAMLKMANEEYGESIYMYYDILSGTQKIKDPEIRARIQIKSYEYLGNMYFIMEDYESAVKYYNKAVYIPLKNLTDNALSKYGSYINRSESYIQLKNYEKAKECSLETEKIIPYLPTNIAVGVKVFRYKNLLLLESRKNNFEKAEEYYNLCLEYLKDDKGSAFLNSSMYVETAHCEMLYLQGKYDEAIEKLNFLLKKDSEEEWGFDTSLYLMLLKLYRETNQIEKYFEIGKNLYNSEKKFNDNLKKDYIQFIKDSYVLDQMKKQEQISKIKIISLGAFAFLAVISIFMGAAQIKKLNRKNFTDALTHICNRKYMDYLAEKPLKEPINAAVVMIDIDYFKNYNDFYGHPAGDIVIKKTADILRKSIRKNDILIRYGGEEFLLVLKNADKEIFIDVYKRIVRNLEKENIVHEKSSVSDKVTLSVGVCFAHFEKTLNLEKSIKSADEALYFSKRNGRNRYTII